jgi:hypothetical protein
MLAGWNTGQAATTAAGTRAICYGAVGGVYVSFNHETDRLELTVDKTGTGLI